MPEHENFLPYGHQSIVDSDIDAVVSVLRTDWLTTGPAVDRFEHDLASITGNPCVAVTSGTAALHVGYAAAGVGPGDEVVTSPLTFVATAATAALHGARIEFVDVDDDTGNISSNAVAAAINSRTKVIAAVDYAGHPAELDELSAIARKSGALLLEDAAHSIGGHWRGRPIGSIADITTFSFFPTKNLTTAEGGAVAIRDTETLRRAREFRNHGLVRDKSRQRYPDEGAWHQEVHEFGLNFRLPDVLCALGSAQLRRLGEFKKRRAEIHAAYNEAFADIDGLRLPTTRRDADPAWHLYAVRVLDGRRKDLYDYLRAAGIGVQVNYIPVYWHPIFEDLGYCRGLCPNAERFYAEELSLPLFPDLTAADIDRVITNVRAFFGAH